MAQFTITPNMQAAIDEAMERLFRMAGLPEHYLPFSFSNQINYGQGVAGGLMGSAANGGVATYVDNSNTLTSGKLLSIRNGGVEQAYFDYLGGIFSNALTGNSATGPLIIKGSYVPPAFSSSVSIDTASNLTTSNSYILTVSNNGTGKFFIDKDGSAFAYLNIVSQAGAIHSRFGFVNDTVGASLTGSAPDSTTAVGVTLNNNVTLASSGAKLLSVQNNGSEQMYVAKDGAIVVTGNNGIYLNPGNKLSELFGSSYVSVGSNTLTIFSGGPITLQAPKLSIPATSNHPVGQATLVSGSVTVSNTSVTASSIIFVSHSGSGTVANFGTLHTSSIIAGTSFVIYSSNASDNDTINYLIIN